MRGGALPMMIWAGVLTLVGTLNAIWTHDLIQSGTYTAALLMIGVTACVLIGRRPEAARRGAPERRSTPEAIPRASTAAPLIAVGAGLLVFGLAFGHFPVYFGAGTIVVGLSRLVLELRAQRRAVAAAVDPDREGTS